MSLFLAAFMSFAAPVILISCAIAVFFVIGYVPGFGELSSQMTSYILEFLAVFGDGNPLQGIITLGLTGGIVGVLFDTLILYRYQSLGNRDLG